METKLLDASNSESNFSEHLNKKTMKKVFKILGIILGILLLIVLCGFLFINFKGIPSYETANIDYHVVSTPESIARGEKLASMLCAGCHMDPETGKLTGTQMLDAPPEFGTVYTPNITQDKDYGIGNWTDAELLYLLRTGIKKDGKYAPPYMAKLPNMADEDINAIISFLRSDHRLVNADPKPDQDSKPSFLTKLLCNLAWKPLPMPSETIEMPDTNDRVALGRYLAYNLECFSCHSADFKTNNFLDPPMSAGYFGGGNKPLNREGKVMYTQNLTPDEETGIGSWTEEKFVKVVKHGIKDGEPAMRYPMPPYTQLTDDEAGAIFQYLRTIPPIKNKVERAAFE